MDSQWTDVDAVMFNQILKGQKEVGKDRPTDRPIDRLTG